MVAFLFSFLFLFSVLAFGCKTWQTRSLSETNGIYNKMSTLSYPRDREYHPIKIFHLNFANCFGLLFHILAGYLKLCAAKSVRRTCMYTQYIVQWL